MNPISPSVSLCVRGGVVALVTCLTLAGDASVAAQPLPFTGYVQTVPVATAAVSPQPDNVSSFNRVRLSTDPVFGAFSAEVAYEHAAAFRWRRQPGGAVGVVPEGGEWLDLQWVAANRKHLRWQHRFDRLAVGWRPADGVELSLGRQAVSWGTTLFLTPADPFSPFSPADPFRQFRAGVDAARVRISPSALSEIDIVVRPSTTTVGNEMTALARGLMTVGNWEVSGWGGSVYGDVAGAAATAGAFGAWAIRGEAVVRSLDGEATFRGTVGTDRLFQIRGKDTFLLIEYQHDRLGATAPGEYLDVLRSSPFRRGELQVIGRDEAVVQASVQIHPLWSVAGLWLWNLNDRSGLASPSVAYSLSDEASLAAGMLVGVGDDALSAARPLPSEYGLAGVTGYVSISWFFP